MTVSNSIVSDAYSKNIHIEEGEESKIMLWAHNRLKDVSSTQPIQEWEASPHQLDANSIQVATSHTCIEE